MAQARLIERETAEESTPKRRQIVEAAEELFLGHGYGAVSMDAVARAAAVSKATLYAYFASKDRLFATIVGERGMSHVLDDGAFPPDGTDMREAMTSVGDRVLRFMLRERTLRIYRIAVTESARFPELGQAFFDSGPRRTCDRLEAWLSRQQALGLVAMPDPKMAASQFAALLRSGVFMRAALAVPPAPEESEITATIDAAVETWLRAFGRP